VDTSLDVDDEEDEELDDDELVSEVLQLSDGDSDSPPLVSSLPRVREVEEGEGLALFRLLLIPSNCAWAID